MFETSIYLQKLIFIFARISSFLILFPGISYKSLPGAVKVTISMAITYVVYMITPDVEIIDNFLLFGLIMTKEILLGLATGYIIQLIFGITEVAGQFVDFQVGFSMGNTMDPTMGTMASYYGRAYYWMSMAIFFILDIHHYMIQAMIQSFEYIPIGSLELNTIPLEAILFLFARIFELGFKLAAPMIAVVLMTDIVLGIISKSIPQINVLMLGMPIKTGVGFIMTTFLLSWLIESIGYNLSTIPGYMEEFFRLLIS